MSLYSSLSIDVLSIWLVGVLLKNRFKLGAHIYVYVNTPALDRAIGKKKLQ